MPKDVKLQALRRAYEIEEQQALEHKKKVEDVVEEREKIVGVLCEKREDLLNTLKRLRTRERRSALQMGDAAQLAAITSYEKRLEGELTEVSEVWRARTKELEQAMERLRLAEQDLVNARIEKKKVEKYLDNRQLSERVVDAAIEEALTDEMNFYRRGK